ncbi:MAG: hypothetical protein MUF84_19315 [Anaerolineae bacterium]|jgi:hypothetical protein|nr:hypothetical protein [Anaerolineae bacterium]
MRLKIWMAAKAIVEVVFGVGFVVMPKTVASLFGMSVDEPAMLMAQLFGSAFIFGSIVLWFCQNLDRDDVAMKAIIKAVVVSNAIGFVVTLMASLSGVWNALGWLPVALYLVFGLAFAAIWFGKQAA